MLALPGHVALKGARRFRPNGRVGAALAALLGVAAALSWAVDRAEDPQRFPIRQVSVGGDLQHVDREALRAAVVESIDGGFFGLDVERVRQAVQALPWVDQARVRRVWPDGLVVTVREQVPLARWRDGALVNLRGEVFDPAGQAPDALPHLHGPADRAAQVSAVYAEVQGRLRGLDLHIAALRLDERRALSMELAGGIELMLGRQDRERRLARLLRVWPEVLAPRREAIARIDLRYGNGFAVAWKTAPQGRTN